MRGQPAPHTVAGPVKQALYHGVSLAYCLPSSQGKGGGGTRMDPHTTEGAATRWLQMLASTRQAVVGTPHHIRGACGCRNKHVRRASRPRPLRHQGNFIVILIIVSPSIVLAALCAHRARHTGPDGCSNCSGSLPPAGPIQALFTTNGPAPRDIHMGHCWWRRGGTADIIIISLHQLLIPLT